ncbi:MAG: DJ-1 family glyoxalase III [Blautia sp.]
MANVCVFFANGFEEVEGLTVVDLLRRAGEAVSMVSISDSLYVTGSHGIQIKADSLFEQAECEKADLLVLPGGMPGTLHLGEHKGLCELLVKFNNEGKKVAAICAAPGVLGANGILKGRKATCYPGCEDKLKGAVLCTEEVVRDGNVTTSRGVGTAIAFGLELIAQLEGEVKAHQIKKSIVY